MVFALANLSLQMLERLVPPELTPRSAFYSRDDNTHNMTCNRIMKLTRELNKTNYFTHSGLAATSRAGVAVGLLVFLANSTPSPALLPWKLN